jgi:hypothetical protein
VQKRQLCKRHDIGPDCRNIGLFNWNNRALVTEELLDDYTSAFVSSETPFVAYTAAVSRRYQTHNSPLPFLPEKSFLEIWFGEGTPPFLSINPKDNARM